MSRIVHLPQDTPADATRLANLCGVAEGNIRELERLLSVEIRRRGARFNIGSAAMIHSRQKSAPQPTAQELLCETLLQTLFQQARQPLPLANIHATFHECRMKKNLPLPQSTAINAEPAKPTKTRPRQTIASRTKAPPPLPSIENDEAQHYSINASRREIRPRTHNQMKYLQAINAGDMVFGVGPAGTGKTYLAVAAAVHALELGQVQRIILTRPALEAGEKLGFLPGSLAEKVDPYLRPVYDALYDMLGPEKFQRHQERGIIEIAPLAFMRGRTLNEAFVILDEAQNTTTEQMKMFLTRVGYGSKMVINGDLTQTDLPTGKNSGLGEASAILQKVDGVAFVFFDRNDVVRHPLVARIIDAYEGLR